MDFLQKWRYIELNMAIWLEIGIIIEISLAF